MKDHLKSLYHAAEKIISKISYLLIRKAPFKYYQPIYGAERDVEVRSCTDRWAVIEAKLDTSPGSVLDIGCNLGFFTFQASEKNKLVTGVDADPFYITACRTIAKAQNRKHAFFQKGFVDIDYLEKMPSYDVVFNFSVFHHWVKAYGRETAVRMMKVLSSKTRSLFFETGQPDEAETKWAEQLSFMGADPKAWIADFLRECGFTNVECLGQFETGLTQVKRYFFYASKNAA